MKLESNICKKNEELSPCRECKYRQGFLYKITGREIVVLCTRTDNTLAGVCIKGGTGYNNFIGIQHHFVGEPRTDWHDSFGEFEGCIEIKQTL